ncbi:MAG: hypothetical protein IT209_10120 [Armatimonadetes bacterium]|nr:hypothetical protein [Armatimonadota bacterium]
MAVVPIFDFMLAGTSPRVSGALERQLPVGLYIAGTAALAAAIGAFIVARQLRVRGLLAGIYGILAVGFSMLAAFYAVFSLVIVFTFGSVRLR